MTKLELNRLKLAMLRSNSEADIEKYNEALLNFSISQKSEDDDDSKKNPSSEIFQVLTQENNDLKEEIALLKEILDKKEQEAEPISEPAQEVIEPEPADLEAPAPKTKAKAK